MSRYIDTDLIEYYTNNYCEDIVRKKQIEAIPTADVRENVHGEWINCKCSVCGFSSYDFGVQQIMHCDYCPNCGTDMRKGKDNG